MSISRLSIRSKIAIGSFFFAFLPLLVLGIYMFQSGKRETIASTEGQLVSLSSAIERQIERHTHHGLDHVMLVAAIPRMIHLAGLAAAMDPAALQEIRGTLGGAVLDGGDIISLSFLRPETGEVLASTDQLMEGMFLDKAPYFTLSRHEPTIYRVHYSLWLERSVMVMGAPVRKGDRVLGVIVAYMDIGGLSSIIAMPAPTDCFLVNRGNLHVIGSGPSGPGVATPIRSGIFTEGAVRALDGQKGSGIYRNHNGTLVVGAYTQVKALDLALLAEVPIAHLHKDINRLGLRIMGLSVLLGLIVLVMSVVVGRQIAYPLLRLTESLRSYGQGSVHQQIEMGGSSAEVNELTRSFNQMILRRNETELALKESEERFRTLFNQATDCIHLLDPEPTDAPVIVDVNEYSCQLHGYEHGELVGRPMTVLDPAMQGPEMAAMAAKLMNGEQVVFDVEHKKKDGSMFPLEVSAQTVVIGGRKYILAIERDITERRRSDERIKASLREKEVLLKEIHHRVKNNLQIISSLLKLQSGFVEDPKVAEMFQESLGRIKSMALIHEKLYQSRDFSHINYKEYLTSLASRLIRYSGTGHTEIALSLDVEDVSLGMDTAIPCGLVINELISNALKHAFPEGGRGQVTLSFKSTEKNRYLLVVKDDGRGLPPGLDIRKTDSMGMMLVTSITEDQLKGSIEVICGGELKGTEFRIAFADPEYTKRI